MNTLKTIALLILRLALACFAMLVAYMVSTMLISQGETTLTPEEASQAGLALLLVSSINALVLSYPIIRSPWHGWKLIGGAFLVQFGVETFMSQVETLYFNRSLGLATSELLELVAAGAIRALIFAPLAVLIFGKLKRSTRLGQPTVPPSWQTWLVRLLVLAGLYVVVYFLFGYFVAWQWQETRLFYSGTADIQPFFTHFRGLFNSQPDILPFQLLRGALWAGLAFIIVRMMQARRWEGALAVALVFAGLLCSGLGLFPNPYMPDAVRQSHFVELLTSMLLFGSIAGWVMR